MTNHVDAHVHLWAFARGDYPWAATLTPESRRDRSVTEMAPILAGSGITAAVLIQAAPTRDETTFLLEQARQSNGLVRGVVGALDLRATDAVPVLAHLARDPLFKAVRLRLADGASAPGADVDRALKVFPRLGLRLEVSASAVHAQSVLELLQRHPDLPVVVDHAAAATARTEDFAAWRAHVGTLGTLARVRCKVTGLVSAAGPGWTIDGIRPWFDALVDAFGPQRLMWGSDWPCLERTATYRSWWAATVAMTRDWTADERAAFLGGAARRFYGI